MGDSLQERADERFDAALEGSGSRDPRDFYRERLRALKAEAPERYDEAVQYYSEVLLPSIADQDRDPLLAWQEYGAKLADWANPGRPVAVDRTGRSVAYEPPAHPEHMVLHLPDARGRAIVVWLPEELSDAQRATYDLMVSGRRELAGTS